MRILVLGGDGYCGWPTALHLSSRGHDVAIVDSFVRRSWDHELGAQTLTPIRPLTERLRVWQRLTGKEIESFVGDILDYEFLSRVMQEFAPEAVVHFAEQRSAPVLDDRPPARRFQPDEQCRRHFECSVCDQGIPA